MKETIKIEIAKKYTTDLDTVITRETCFIYVKIWPYVP